MSRKNLTWGKQLLFGAGVFVLTSVTSAAAVLAAGTVSVSPSKSSVAVSEQITVNVQTSEPQDPSTPPQISVSYDPSVLQFDSCDVDFGGGEGGLVTMSGTGGTLTFTALSAGSANVSAEAIIDEDGNNPATSQAAIQIAGQEGAGGAAATENAGGAGSSATLRALAIEPGVLSPAFTPENTNYTITIPEGVTDITVSGGVSDPSSQISSATGFKGLGEDESQAQITVTAADGSTLEYHFTIVRGDVEAAAAEAAATQEAAPAETTEEAADATAAGSAATGEQSGDGMSAGFGIGSGIKAGGNMTLVIGQSSYTIQPTIPDDLLPSGASKTSITYADQSIEAATLAGGALTLVCASSNVDNGNKLFIYDAASGSFQGFAVINAAGGGYIIPVVLPQSMPGGFVVEGCDIQGNYISCGKLKDSSVQQRENVCLLYAMDQDGSLDYYLYDLSGGGYVHFLNASAGSSSAGGFSKRAIAIIVLLGVAFLAAMIALLAVSMNRGGDFTMDDEPEDPEPIQPERVQRRRRPVRPMEEEDEEDQPQRAAGQATVKKKRRPMPQPAEDTEDEEGYDRSLETSPGHSVKRRPAPRPEAEPAAEKSSMPEPTVKKVRKTKRVERPAYSQEGDEGFDIDKEIAAMKENAVRKSATARMANVEETLKRQGTRSTRTVMPEGSGAQRPEGQRPKKPARPRPQSSEDGRVRRPVKSDRVVTPQTEDEAEVKRPKVTKKVTEKGVTYTTGKIPITVVEAAKPAGEEAKSSVPIFTLGQEEPAEQAPAQIPEQLIREELDYEDLGTEDTQE
ncbi:MAG: hypothetical protein K6E18_07720 [Lachnospiraceae bacterium]|nr:hypothetical protein [Lachnospiraceae bacterium]